MYEKSAELTRSISEKSKQFVNNVSDNVVRASQSAREYMSSYTSSTTAIVGLIIVILVAVLTTYGLYVLVTGVIFQKAKEIVDGTKTPIICNVRTNIPVTNFTTTANGKKRSYTFWIYINDINKYNGMYKHVLHVGDNLGITKGSPYVILDKNTNAMYVRLSAQDSSKETLKTSYDSFTSITDSDFYEYMRQGIVIKYVPLQRWVHIAIVVDDSITNGGTMTAYVDGDVSSSLSHGDTIPFLDTSISKTTSYTDLDLDKKGNLYTGGNVYGAEGPGFSGLISKFTFFNYDLNQEDVYKDYNSGPIDGLFAKLGIGQYGVRNPIYKIV